MPDVHSTPNTISSFFFSPGNCSLVRPNIGIRKLNSASMEDHPPDSRVRYRIPIQLNVKWRIFGAEKPSKACLLPQRKKDADLCIQRRIAVAAGNFLSFFLFIKMSGHGCVFEANVNGQHPKSHRWSIAVPSVSFLNTWRRTMKISRTHSIERVHNVVLCSCCCRKKKRRNCFWKNELFEEVQLSFWRAFVVIRRVSVDWLPHVPSSWNGNNSGACLPTPPPMHRGSWSRWIPTVVVQCRFYIDRSVPLVPHTPARWIKYQLSFCS